MSAPFFVGEPVVFSTLRYDAAGRLVRTTNPDGTTVTRTPVVRDGLAGTTDTDETGRASTRLSDGWGALTVTEEPSTTTPGTTATTRQTYDFAGDPLTTTDAAGQVSTDSYDSLGRLRTQQDPDRGDTVSSYDPVGNLTAVTDARGRLTTYEYDPLRRQTTKTDHTTGRVARWSYDQAGHGAGIGRLSSLSDSSAIGCPSQLSHSYTYDLSGNATTEVRCVIGHTLTFASRYSQAGRLAAITYPDGEKVSYTYNSAGDLASAGTYMSAMTYDAAGQLRTARYGDGTAATWRYDTTRHRLTGQSVTQGPTPLLDFAYTYETNGLVHTSTSMSNQVDETYGYDMLDRLTTVSGTTSQNLTYDDVGNMTSNSRIGAYSYPAQRTCTAPTAGSSPSCAGPHAVTAAGASSYRYDAAGNMTTVAESGTDTRTLDWNTDGQLISVHDRTAGTVDNIYDANGERVLQTAGRGTIDLFGPLAEWSPTDGLTTYIYAGSHLVARHHGTDRSWYHADRLGSPRLITDAAGHPRERPNYGPWGEPAKSPLPLSTTPDPHGYTGERSLGSTGLVDLAARAYDPQLGRMLSADSIIPDAADPQALNRYSYAYNNPVTYTDPTGHAPDQGNGWVGQSGWSDFLQASQAYLSQGATGLFESAGQRFTQTISLRTEEMTPAELARYMARSGDEPTSGEYGLTLGYPVPPSQPTTRAPQAAVGTPKVKAPQVVPSSVATPTLKVVSETGEFTPQLLKNVWPGYDGWVTPSGFVWPVPTGSLDQNLAADLQAAPAGTAQIGFTIAGHLGHIWVSGFLGLAIDQAGERGIYAGGGAWPGVGLDANVSLNYWMSNAAGIEDLSGVFYTVNAGGGVAGHVSVDVSREVARTVKCGGRLLGRDRRRSISVRGRNLHIPGDPETDRRLVHAPAANT